MITEEEIQWIVATAQGWGLVVLGTETSGDTVRLTIKLPKPRR